jgi:hypothetical protein
MGNSENMCESGARSDVAISEIGCSQFAVGWPSGSRTQDPCLAERGQLPGEASQKSPSVYPIVRLRIERRTGNKLRTKLNLSRNASILLRLVEDCRLCNVRFSQRFDQSCGPAVPPVSPVANSQFSHFRPEKHLVFIDSPPPSTVAGWCLHHILLQAI